MTAEKMARPKMVYELHGMKRSPEYSTWRDIKLRCLNPKNKNFDRYGGRGIYVCDEWRNSFNAFLADMGKRPSPKHRIDRIDNDDGYYKSNCRWATMAEQAANRCTTKWISYGGETLTSSEWAKRLGDEKGAVVSARIRLGWPPERAVTTPIKVSNRNGTLPATKKGEK